VSEASDSVRVVHSRTDDLVRQAEALVQELQDKSSQLREVIHDLAEEQDGD
jgi:uncharacterized protein YoxC